MSSNLHAFLCDTLILQVIITYISYNVYISQTLFYNVFYFTVLIIFLGLQLSSYQLDLFAAFLWMAEFVIIFITILYVFFLNVYSVSFKRNNFFFTIKMFLIFLFLILISEFLFLYQDNSNQYIYENSINIYDNMYMHIDISILNDFFSFFKSYFFLNSLEFFFIGLLLLLSSFVCVNLNFFSKNNKVINYYGLFSIFDFFKDFSKFIFMRKQNLNDQLNTYESIRFFMGKRIK